MKKLLFIAFVFSILQQANAQLCFYTAANYTVGTNTNTKNITSGDFNGDGFQDLAVAIVTPSMVSILLSDGAGHFNTANTYTTNSQPYSICSADFNGDGKADVAVVNNGPSFHGFSVMLGNGAGGLGAATGYSAGTNPAWICTGDFNGDGKKDLAFTDINAAPSAALPVYLGNGAGSFSLYTTITLGTGTVSIEPTVMVCADVTGDNKVDFIIACESATNKVTICPGNGLGGATTPYAYNVGSGTTYNQMGLALADFDGNNKIDIVTSNGSSGNITVLLNNSTSPGVFTANSYVAGNNPQAVACADFDGDGDVDVAVANSSNNQIGILLNNGLGVFTSPSTATSFAVDTDPIQFVSADFNGDGRPDIATANQGADNTSVLLNSLPNTISITGTTTVCVGQSTILIAAGTDNYTWTANAGSVTTNSVSVSPTGNITYTVTGSNTNCTLTATDTVRVSVNQLPTINIVATPNYICNANTITLTATGATTYTWSNGITNGAAFTPTAVATYTVKATDSNNCEDSATINIGLSVPQVPQICLVTTDSATNYNYNIIYWDNTQYTNVDSFIVYRYEIIAGVYTKIGMVSGDSSRMIDTTRHVEGVNDGDPNFTSYRYTLAIKDSCGNVGQQGPYHETVFLQDQHNGNFNLNPYTISTGQTNPVTGYALFKDPTGTGNNFTYLTSISSTLGTDPSYSSTANYRVDILGFDCVINQRLANPNNNPYVVRQRSHSNTSKRLASGINKVVGNNYEISVYPNPTTGNFVIETNITTTQTIQLFDVNGKLVLTQTVNGNSVIDASNLANGVYNLSLISIDGVVNKRLVIVK